MSRPSVAGLARLASLALTGVALASATLLIYALVHFRASIEPRALLWYGLALGLIGASLAGRKLPGGLQIGLVLGLGSTAASLWILEAALQFARDRAADRTRAAVAALYDSTYDLRTIPEFVLALRAAGTPAVPSIVPKVMLDATAPGTPSVVGFDAPFMPLAGISRALTVQLCNEDGQYKQYQSDRYGFNNPDAVWDTPPPRLVLIGDSFVHGFCVAADSTLPARLRASLPSTISLGLGGSGPLSELGVLSEYGEVARPAVVAWVYFENDLRDLAFERQMPQVTAYLEAGYTQGLAGRQPEIDSTLAAWVDATYAAGVAADPLDARGSLWSVLTLRSLRGLVAQLQRGAAADPREQLALFREILEAAQRRTARLGAQMVFVFLPDWERVVGAEARTDDAARPGVLAAAADLGIPMIDLTAAFTEHQNPAALFARGRISKAHYSPAGYRLAAEGIARALDSLSVFPGVRPKP